MCEKCRALIGWDTPFQNVNFIAPSELYGAIWRPALVHNINSGGWSKALVKVATNTACKLLDIRLLGGQSGSLPSIQNIDRCVIHIEPNIPLATPTIAKSLLGGLYFLIRQHARTLGLQEHDIRTMFGHKTFHGIRKMLACQPGETFTLSDEESVNIIIHNPSGLQSKLEELNANQYRSHFIKCYTSNNTMTVEIVMYSEIFAIATFAQVIPIEDPLKDMYVFREQELDISQAGKTLFAQPTRLHLTFFR
jgi:hypothetical protein